jgi:hypothetical protein
MDNLLIACLHTAVLVLLVSGDGLPQNWIIVLSLGGNPKAAAPGALSPKTAPMGST